MRENSFGEVRASKRAHFKPYGRAKTDWTWQICGGVVGLAGGLVAILCGAVFTALSWLSASPDNVSYLRTCGTVLFSLSIPLLIVGAHCLDLSDKRRTAPPRAAPPGENSEPGQKAAGARRGDEKLRLITGLLVAGALLTSLGATARAQQTLFNVPSTDVLEKGKVYFELDTSFKPAEPRFSSFVPRVVVGAGRGVEVGVNLTGNVQPGADATTLVPTVKWKPYDGGANGWAFVVGNNLFIPLRNRRHDAGNYAYAELSKTFRTKTRLTAGGYHFTPDVVAPDAHRAGGQFGFEQTVTKKLAVLADWLTGRHANGYFTPGALYRLAPKVTGYVGYSLGNADARRGNHFIYAQVGVNFN